ncbi:glutathione S-transferase family protein [Maricaulis sp. CAU 1757]
MARPVLHIGDKRLSSWSLRAWLVLRHGGFDFEERLIRLDRPETHAALKALSPGATVPVLEVDGVHIWDSLAIAEWAAERVPTLWPEDASQRALARSVTAHMHSGFAALRSACPMDLGRAETPFDPGPAVQRDVDTVQALWARAPGGEGTWLFGRWSIADAFYAPIATRFRTYGIKLKPAAQRYCEALLDEQHYRHWRAGALEDNGSHPA